MRVDEHEGAVEGDKPQDPQQGNENAQALDDEGMPDDCDKVAEDVIGATWTRPRASQNAWRGVTDAVRPRPIHTVNDS
jgi:hypothetical protein